jgi:uncharacterized protein (TIGR02996 family)
MGLREELLRAVREDPHDEAARGALADWLQEHGETEAERARGELMTAVTHLALLSRADPRWDRLRSRVRELLHCWREQWLGPLSTVSDVEFRNGLVVLTWYRLKTFTTEVAALAGTAEYAWVVATQLRVSDGLGTADVQSLAANSHVERLEFLFLGGGYRSAGPIGDQGAVALAASPHLQRLESLGLAFQRIGDAGGWALAQSPYLGRLSFLDLRGNTLGAAARQALLDRYGSAMRL